MMDQERQVIIHGDLWERSDVKKVVADCKELNWIEANYDGKGSHDHCEICWWELFESDDSTHGVGYKNNNQWLCSECFSNLINVEDERAKL